MQAATQSHKRTRPAISPLTRVEAIGREWGLFAYLFAILSGVM